MNPNEFRAGLAQLVDFARTNANSLSPQVKARFAEFLQAASARLEALQAEQEQQQQQAVPPQQQIPDTARLLWVAAGGNTQAFINFIQTYPSPETRDLVRNPERLVQVIRALNEEIPRGEPTISDDGIESSWLPSSNVYGFNYDPKNKRMYVQFNGKDRKEDGSVYSYENVPQEIAAVVEAGSIPAKTTGRNRHGSWWRSKSPSIGSSVSALLVKGGFPYRKLT